MKFLEAHPEGVNAIILEIEETALHIAVTFEHLHIVKELVNKMQEGDLEWKNEFGETALVTATSTGIIEMAKCMIEKKRNLPMIPTDTSSLPITKAVIRNKKEMAFYLYSIIPLEELEPENGCHGANLPWQCFLSDSIVVGSFYFGNVGSIIAKVFNLIYGVTSSIRDDLASIYDKAKNKALHMAALLAPSEQLNRIPGAALQMQRELQWFKATRDSRCAFVLQSGQCLIKGLPGWKMIGFAKDTSGLYQLVKPEIKGRQPEVALGKTSSAYCNNTSSNNPVLWHLRLGHPHFEKLRLLAQKSNNVQ
ncbi:hypothetical protein L6164_008752 [Bauhinia variegata]|uniref:Uncharacterized protein n=1 Tax=Bauhinia variegata TaxID=167791 RepID=A0ACB9PKI4_BAUVA|nr:hypothetical protein L6164_008752 [Bauhinia variegata]